MTEKRAGSGYKVSVTSLTGTGITKSMHCSAWRRMVRALQSHVHNGAHEYSHRQHACQQDNDCQKPKQEYSHRQHACQQDNDCQKPKQGHVRPARKTFHKDGHLPRRLGSPLRIVVLIVLILYYFMVLRINRDHSGSRKHRSCLAYACRSASKDECIVCSVVSNVQGVGKKERIDKTVD